VRRRDVSRRHRPKACGHFTGPPALCDRSQPPSLPSPVRQARDVERFSVLLGRTCCARGWLAEGSVPRLSILTRWQPGVLPCVTLLTHSSTIAHLTSCMCFVSASCQTIVALNQPDRDNLGWITGMSPLTRLSDSSEIYSVGIDHRQPTDKRDYRRQSSLLLIQSMIVLLTITGP